MTEHRTQNTEHWGMSGNSRFVAGKICRFELSGVGTTRAVARFPRVKRRAFVRAEPPSLRLRSATCTMKRT